MTRAMGPPGETAYTVASAEALLRKKLKGVVASSQASLDGFAKQILHCWCPTAEAAEAIETAYASLWTEPSLTADTVVLVTLCEGLRAMFTEKAPAPSTIKKERAVKGLKDAAHLRALHASDPLKSGRAAAWAGAG